MDNIKNKSKVAIVVVGFNRLYSISRLLKSLLKANYDNSDIPLVISIDKSDDYNLYSYVNDFVWPHGEKFVIIKTSRLGLKEHILQCGNLTKYFRAIILLEDDLYVSPEFYRYVLAVLDKYEDDPIIAGISLYKNEWNGFLHIPIDILNNGSDVFLAQAVSSWGQCWNESMWNPFVLWYQNTIIDLSKIEMLDEIKKWKNAWSVNFYVYMILLDKYFIFPQISLTTNFSEAGVHGDKGTTDYQVKLLAGRKKYELFPSYNLVKYDVYLNNIDLYKHLDISKDNLCVDLYGNNQNNYSKQYWLTTLYKPYKVIKSYGLYLRPHELNIFNNIEGNDIFLYDTYITSNTIRKQGTNIAFLDFHVKEYSNKILIYVTFIRYKRLIFTKLKYLTRKILFRKERLFKGIIKKITVVILVYSSDITDAIFTFLGGINARKMHGIIIMFHNIVIENIERNDPERCPINKFISILDKLKEKNIEVVSINELLNKRKNKKFAIITFDDALLNTYTIAYPILKKRNIPFTTFITTGFINKHGHISLDQLKALGEEELCTIGSHTITHPFLKGYKNAYNEINNSKTELENILKKEIIHFAYTYGKIHAFSIKNIYQTKKAGYLTAATSIKGEISILTALFLRFLPRVECNDALFFLNKF